jgi:mannose-1-phosphate guanylyltransferase/mannose-6-phosphate isomerase
MKIVVTILSGGAGSRLWPVSRENYPKPFIKLQDQQSLLQKAFIRGVNLPHVVQALCRLMVEADLRRNQSGQVF